MYMYGKEMLQVMPFSSSYYCIVSLFYSFFIQEVGVW